MSIFRKKSDKFGRSTEKSGKIEIDQYVEEERLALDILREKGKQAREQREGINNLLLQLTSSVIALMAAVALFILPTSDNVKSHAKDILIFLGGGASGYAIQKANQKSDKDAE